MNEIDNPYQSPAENGSDLPAPAPVRVDGLSIVSWPFVFAMNLVVPLMCSEGMTRNHGRTGLGIAVLGILACGWAICAVSCAWGRRLVLGSFLTALLQLFPIAHLLLGFAALSIADYFGMVVNSGGIGEVASEFGGFLITMIVASGLLVIAACLGWAGGMLLPPGWLGKRTSKL